MRKLYARFVLFLIRPALELHCERTRAPEALQTNKAPALDLESVCLLRESVAGWLKEGDLSQAHLLRDATHKAATVMSILLLAERLHFEEGKSPSEPPQADDTPGQTLL